MLNFVHAVTSYSRPNGVLHVQRKEGGGGGEGEVIQCLDGFVTIAMDLHMKVLPFEINMLLPL